MSDDSTAYFQRATTWALDEQANTLASLRQTRIVTGVVALIAILEAFALMLLTPLKTVTMVPVLVDRQTGFVELLRPDGRQELQANQALTQSLLAQYVVARESFDIASVSADYHKVALWSDGAARRDYLAVMPASNPASPLRRYPRTARVETSIKSVSPLGAHAALVRFDTSRRDQDAQAAPRQAWAAVISYRFADKPLSVADRWLNPLGFEVTSYHRDPETPPPEAGAQTADSMARAPIGASTPASAPAGAVASAISSQSLPIGRPRR